MAKRNDIEIMKKVELKVQKHFHFKNDSEFVIFLIWALFTSAVLLSIIQ